jgi:hypothetical protein
MSLHCPNCEARVLSRRNRLCSVCHRPLPAGLLMTPAELEAVEAQERERARQSRLREERRRAAYEQAREYGGG